jgi:putative hemolysin
VGLVVVLITYLSLVIGELVPKQLALRNAEAVAARVAPAMRVLSRVATPAAWLLDVSSDLVLRLFGSEERRGPSVTEEEIRMLIAEAETAGVIEPEERRMITGVLRLGDRPVRALMTPRAEVEWIDLWDPPEAICARILDSSHSSLPAGESSVDALVGVIRARDLLAALASAAPGEPAATPRAAALRAAASLDFRAMVRPAPIVPDTADAMDVLGRLREAPMPMALIHDEYGNFEGIVTPADLMEAIAGAFHREEEAEEPDAVEREDGSWLLSGGMPADDMADRLGLRLPERRDYHTVAGFMLAEMRRLPQVGESFDALGWRFEVVDLDRGRRIDKVLAQHLPVRSRPRG